MQYCLISKDLFQLYYRDSVCGEPQTMEHFSQALKCTGDDLVEPTAAAVACADYCKDSM